MPVSKADLLQGTLDLLILKTLALGPLHGWAVSKRIQQMSKDVLTVNQGSLYPALYRLEDRGWIAGAEGESAEGRRIKLYKLTAAGRRQLADELDTVEVVLGRHQPRDQGGLMTPNLCSAGCGGFACSSAGTRSSGRWTPRCGITSSARRRSTSGRAWRPTRRAGGRCAISAASKRSRRPRATRAAAGRSRISSSICATRRACFGATRGSRPPRS